jgi:hypothetical protein
LYWSWRLVYSSSPLAHQIWKFQIKEKDVNIGEICATVIYIPKAKSWHCIILVDLDLWSGDLVHVHGTMSEDERLCLNNSIHVNLKVPCAQRGRKSTQNNTENICAKLYLNPFIYIEVILATECFISFFDHWPISGTLNFATYTSMFRATLCHTMENTCLE